MVPNLVIFTKTKPNWNLHTRAGPFCRAAKPRFWAHSRNFPWLSLCCNGPGTGLGTAFIQA
jgi:hypothetical protein